ncbi:hypothetical protein DPMN_066679 [Dreissena polymorpha]|uniref:Reverse transcriptase n=1 Tax=Dreissena polymorpha TaxID=45954 RepID=A0A9D3YUH1_DREPO|nr:hypothetical protein DPMN_066679 [Dreissena polymorpha]
MYVCFLDGKQTFDNVWHAGLLYKLWKCNIDYTSLLAIKKLYMNAKSYVLSHGRRSQEFPFCKVPARVVKAHRYCTWCSSMVLSNNWRIAGLVFVFTT